MKGAALAGPTVAMIFARRLRNICVFLDLRCAPSKDKDGPKIVYVRQGRTRADKVSYLVEQRIAVVRLQHLAWVQTRSESPAQRIGPD